MNHPFRLHAAILAVLAFAGGCTTTSSQSTNNGPACAPASLVNGCDGGGMGFSCTGGATPSDTNSSLSCGAGSPSSGGSMLFCCSSSGNMMGGSCAPDSRITDCPQGSNPYACTGSAVPQDSDPTLGCGTGAMGIGGTTVYCCAVPGQDAGGTCKRDDTLKCPTSGSFPFTCTGGGNTPTFDNPSLLCSAGTDTRGSTLYCCTSAVGSPDGAPCAPDTSRSCPAGMSSYLCYGMAMPTDQDPTLSCGMPFVGGNQLPTYCCGHGGGVTVDSGTVTDAGGQ